MNSKDTFLPKPCLDEYIKAIQGWMESDPSINPSSTLQPNIHVGLVSTNGILFIDLAQVIIAPVSQKQGNSAERNVYNEMVSTDPQTCP
jgi:hypothetical protein